MDGVVSSIPFTTASLMTACISVLSNVVVKPGKGTASTSTSSAEPGTSRMTIRETENHAGIDDSVMNVEFDIDFPQLNLSHDSQVDPIVENFQTDALESIMAIIDKDYDDDANDFVLPKTPEVPHPQRKVGVSKKQLGMRLGSIKKNTKSSLGAGPSRLREILTKPIANNGNRMLPSSDIASVADVGTGVIPTPDLLSDGSMAAEVFNFARYAGWQKQLREKRTKMSDIRRHIRDQSRKRSEVREEIRRLQDKIKELQGEEQVVSQNMAVGENKISALEKEVSTLVSDIGIVERLFSSNADGNV